MGKDEQNKNAVVPINLCHPHYALDENVEDEYWADRHEERPGVDTVVEADHSLPDGAHAWESLESNDTMQLQEPEDFETAEREDPDSGSLHRAQNTCPVNEAPMDEGGPLTIVRSLMRTGEPPSYAVHFLCTSGSRAGRTVGCNRRLKPERYVAVPSLEEWTEICSDSNICKFCSIKYCLPREWLDLTLGDGNDDGTSSSDSESDETSGESEDTESKGSKRPKLADWS